VNCPHTYYPLYRLYINDAYQTPGTHQALFGDDTCIYANDREGSIIGKLQRGLTAMEAWCDRWNIKINEDKRKAIYFSSGNELAECHLTLKGQRNHVKYLGVIFERKLYGDCIQQ